MLGGSLLALFHFKNIMLNLERFSRRSCRCTGTRFQKHYVKFRALKTRKPYLLESSNFKNIMLNLELSWLVLFCLYLVEFQKHYVKFRAEITMTKENAKLLFQKHYVKFRAEHAAHDYRYLPLFQKHYVKFRAFDILGNLVKKGYFKNIMLNLEQL